MKIGIIGSGHIGGTLARLFTKAGHQIVISNSRGPESLSSFAQELGANASPGTVEEAAAFGEIVCVAIPYGKYQAVPSKFVAGKIVVDAMNYNPQRDGEIGDLATLTSSELVARHLSGARVVKAFNTMQAPVLASGGQPEAPADERLALLVAADDPEARAVVSHLIEEIGFTPIPTGSLHEGGRKQQPGSPVFTKRLTAREARHALSTPTLRQ
ncbi:MAG: NADPH-dependent F420 reductase [Chloroflexota bacterium]